MFPRALLAALLLLAVWVTDRAAVRPGESTALVSSSATVDPSGPAAASDTAPSSDAVAGDACDGSEGQWQAPVSPGLVVTGVSSHLAPGDCQIPDALRQSTAAAVHRRAASTLPAVLHPPHLRDIPLLI